MAKDLPQDSQRRRLLARTAAGGANLALAPGEVCSIPLVYCWHVGDSELSYGQTPTDDRCAPTYRPLYATRFDDAWAVARHCLESHDALQERRADFTARRSVPPCPTMCSMPCRPTWASSSRLPCCGRRTGRCGAGRGRRAAMAVAPDPVPMSGTKRRPYPICSRRSYGRCAISNCNTRWTGAGT